MTSIINVYGPAGCGKSTNSTAIMDYFKADALVEETLPKAQHYTRIVVLSQEPITDDSAQHVPFDNIKELL